MSSAPSRIYMLKLFAQHFLSSQCLLGSHQQQGLPLGCQHMELSLLRERGLKCSTSHWQPQGSL